MFPTKMQSYSVLRAIDRNLITDKSRDWKSYANISSCQVAARPIRSRFCLEKKKKSLSPHAEANPQQDVYTSDAKIYVAKEHERAEDWEAGTPAACCIRQECCCLGNRQPQVGIWSSRWSYCRGFRVQHTSGRSAHMVLSSLLSIPFISDSSDLAAL